MVGHCMPESLWVMLVLAALLVQCQCHQVPFPSVAKQRDAVVQDDLVAADWDLNTPPERNNTDNLVFDTVFSLLQHWPNTRYRNGHTIVPGSIPRGTLLYHGTGSSETPTGPEWMATDPEHSYLFCRTGPDSDTGRGCWHLTFVTTRSLNILYFDGSSAAKMQGGPMDSQDIVLWGEIKPEWTRDEEKRIEELCEWGKRFGIDAFVRMALDFEIMMCDFNNGLQAVSKLQLVSPVIDDKPTDDPRQVLLHDKPIVDAIEAGSFHDRYPGVPHIHLDLSRLVSFYDIDLVPSLIPTRLGQSRYEHSLKNISSHDSQAVRTDIISQLISPPGRSSEIDWKGLFRVIALRYSDRLEDIQHLLNSTEVEGSSHTSSDIVRLIFAQLKTILAPYTLQSAISSRSVAHNHWPAPVFRLCATSHTDFATSISYEITRSERLLLRAARGTNREICRVIVRMWAYAIEEGLDPAFQYSSTGSINLSEDQIQTVLERWRAEFDGLIRWLDWSIWIKCRPACAFEEMCYLPTWNLFQDRKGPEYWKIPKPKCVRRMEPYAIETW